MAEEQIIKQENDDFNYSQDSRIISELLMRMEQKNNYPNTNMPQQTSEPAAQEKIIDLGELFYYLLSKIYIFIIAAVVCGAIMGFYAYEAPIYYKATAKLYLVPHAEDTTISDLQVGTVLASDYLEAFNTWEIHQMVNNLLGTDYSYNTMQKMVTVVNPNSTRVLTITVKDEDPELAAKLANAYAEVAPIFMKDENPISFSEALVPSEPSSASILKSIIMGAAIGIVLALLALSVLFLLDNRPKSIDDITHYGGIPLLAMIPKTPQLDERKQYEIKAIPQKTTTNKATEATDKNKETKNENKRKAGGK